jgi:predicted RNase H-like HicB family nuclease
MNNPYSILIQWSNEDQKYIKYIASLPEFGPDARTHRKTHEEALAQEVLAMMIETQAQGKPLPQPQVLCSQAA